MAIGVVAGAIVVFSIIALDKRKIDDPVGAISVHGVCGFFGLMVVPLSNADASFGFSASRCSRYLRLGFSYFLVVWSILKANNGYPSI